MAKLDESGVNPELEEVLAAEPHPVKQLLESSEIRRQLSDDEYVEKNPKQDFANLKQLHKNYAEASETDRTRIAGKVGEYLTAWANEYDPDINLKSSQLPIEQRYFPEMFAAAAVAYDELDEPAKQAAIELANKTVENDAAWWENREWSSHNNRYCYSLQLRASAAALIAKEDQEEGLTHAAKTKTDLEKHLETFVGEDGATADFKERDSLHYQIFGLQPLLETAATLEGQGIALTDQDRQALTRAVDFLKPYASGEKTHFEFVNTTNPRDQARNAGNFGQPYSVEDNFELSGIFITAEKVLGQPK